MDDRLNIRMTDRQHAGRERLRIPKSGWSAKRARQHYRYFVPKQTRIRFANKRRIRCRVLSRYDVSAQ